MSGFDDDRPPQEVGTLVEGLFRKRRREPVLKVNRLRQHWSGIVGEALARVTQPTRIAKGVLWITALDTGWAFNLQFVKADILNAARTFLESDEIRDIRFKAGPLPEAAAPRREGEPGKTESAVPAPAAAEAASAAPAEATASPIADAKLRERFQRVSAKLKARRNPRKD
jgi:hypothetical protein